jgi:hypothetical protein
VNHRADISSGVVRFAAKALEKVLASTTVRLNQIRVVRLRTTLRTQRNDLTGAKRQEHTPIDLDHLGTQR